MRALIADRQPATIDYAGWKAIDLHERRTAGAYRRPRIKLTSVAEMLRVGADAREVAG